MLDFAWLAPIRDSLVAWWTPDHVTRGLGALAVIAVGWAVSRLVRVLLRRALHQWSGGRIGPQGQMMLGRAVTLVLFGLTVALAARVLGVELAVVLAPLLASAGVLTVAIGFASQTSASNLISGLFLLGERPFVVGDFVRLEDGSEGEVLSIDLMSVKLRTFDNLFLRVPNEVLLKSRITNMTRNPIRRYDLKLSVRYSDDLDHVRKVLLDVTDDMPLVLDEPAPVVHFVALAPDGVDLQFSIWSAREDFIVVRNSIANRVLRAFDANGIVVPFPQRTISVEPPPKP